MDSQRQNNKTEESMASTASSILESAAAALAYVKGSLREIDINTEEDTKTRLCRWLSVRSVISTTSSNAIARQEAASSGELRVFLSIGRGFCAEVFAQVGAGTVFKRAHTPHDLQLWNDWKQHVKVYQAILQAPFIGIHVPKVHCYLSRNDQKWWTENRGRWQSPNLNEPTDLLKMEHILPLPKVVRESLIEHYCPEEHRDHARKDRKNDHCLIRVYLGRRRNFRSQESFSLRNFEADLTIIDELGLEKEEHARTIASALAVVHWSALIDGADVEFVLGSAPIKLSPSFPAKYVDFVPPRTDTGVYLNFTKRAVHLWLLDFNRCNEISMDFVGVDRAVNAFWDNDPYYPRPVPDDHRDAGLWKTFEESYLRQSEESANEAAKKQNLPQLFIRGVVDEAERRGLAMSGPPRGGPAAGPSGSAENRTKAGRGRGGRGGRGGRTGSGLMDITELM
ncbi:hypothetical protein MMC16_007565 [Acarospora aff. strigata]|nr:hypothetical protein [Acarospora aff. strigata]